MMLVPNNEQALFWLGFMSEADKAKLKRLQPLNTYSIFIQLGIEYLYKGWSEEQLERAILNFSDSQRRDDPFLYNLALECGQIEKGDDYIDLIVDFIITNLS